MGWSIVADQCEEGMTCNMFLGYCTIQCEQADDCPDPASGNATPDCSQFGDCVLPCDNGEECPDGMSCPMFGFEICEY